METHRVLQPGGWGMLEGFGNIREKMANVFKRVFMIAMYIGVLLSLFAIHKYLLLNDGSLASHIGFSFLNAWALAKVILVGQELRIGDRFRNRALIYVIAFKSAIFAVLLLVFRLIEEAVIGAVDGKNIYDAVFSGHPGLEHNKFQGMVLTCIIMFFALMPFFAYLELGRMLGEDRMRAMMFGGVVENDLPQDETSAQVERRASTASSSIGSARADPENAMRERSPISTLAREQEISSAYQDQWFYEQSGEVMGPVSERELLRFLRLGVIGPSTLVHNVSVGEGWRLIEETLIV
jgi:hypothetical protein